MNLGDIFGRVLETLGGANRQQPQDGNILDASQDPYGDPADTYQGHQVLDASQDPYGDPADTYQGHQVLDASQDPYGDPADEEEVAGNGRGWFNS